MIHTEPSEPDILRAGIPLDEKQMFDCACGQSGIFYFLRIEMDGFPA